MTKLIPIKHAADELGLTVQTAESKRGRRTRTVTDSVVKERKVRPAVSRAKCRNHEAPPPLSNAMWETPILPRPTAEPMAAKIKTRRLEKPSRFGRLR